MDQTYVVSPTGEQYDDAEKDDHQVQDYDEASNHDFSSHPIEDDDLHSLESAQKFAGGPEVRSRTPRRNKKKASKHQRLSKKVNSFLKTIEEDPASIVAAGRDMAESGNDSTTNGADLYSTLTEDERLAALELAEKLRRRAATLKRRRKLRERRQREGDISSETE